MEVEMGEARWTERPAELVREYERHANGSETFYKHWLGIIYTDGVNFLAETCGAHWLIDAVASHQPAVRRKLRAMDSRDFQVWRLRKAHAVKPAWVLECWSDTPNQSTLLCVQRISYSDFPEDLAPFECYLEEGTLMLKGER